MRILFRIVMATVGAVCGWFMAILIVGGIVCLANWTLDPIALNWAPWLPHDGVSGVVIRTFAAVLTFVTGISMLSVPSEEIFDQEG